MLKDVTKLEEGVVEEGKDIVLQLEGYMAQIDIENNGKLRIINGGIIGEDYELGTGGGNISNKGELSIENIEIINKYYITNDGTLNINSVEVDVGNLINNGNINIKKLQSTSGKSFIWNDFINSENMIIEECDVSNIAIENNKKLIIKNSKLEGVDAWSKHILLNQGTCEILEDSRIYSGGKSYSDGERTIINQENSELTINGGYVGAREAVLNFGKITLKGNLEVEPQSNFLGFDNEVTGELIIEDNVIISGYVFSPLIKNNGGKIQMLGGRIENTTDGYAIYNNGGTVEVSENAVVIPDLH